MTTDNTDREELDGSMTTEQLERASLIAESRGIDMETAQELVYLRGRAAVAGDELHRTIAEAAIIDHIADENWPDAPTRLSNAVERLLEYRAEVGLNTLCRYCRQSVYRSVIDGCWFHAATHNSICEIVSSTVMKAAPLRPTKPAPLLPTVYMGFADDADMLADAAVSSSLLAEPVSNAPAAAPAPVEQEQSPEKVAHEDSYWDDPLRGTNKMLTLRERITEIVDRYVDADFPSVRKALIDEVEALMDDPSPSVQKAAEALKSAGLLWSNEAAAELGGEPFDDKAQIEQVAAILSKHFPSAVPVEEQKCTCCGGLECECGPFVALNFESD